MPARTQAKILLGLSPLWASIVLLVAGSFVSGSPDYWNVAPWIVVAALPVCAVTLGWIEWTSRRNRNDGQVPSR